MSEKETAFGTGWAQRSARAALVRAGLDDEAADELLKKIQQEAVFEDLVTHDEREAISTRILTGIVDKFSKLSEKKKSIIRDITVGIVTAAIWDSTKEVYSEIDKDNTKTLKQIHSFNKLIEDANETMMVLMPAFVYIKRDFNSNDSEKTFRTSLNGIIEYFGPTDLRTILFRNSLALALEGQGRYREAEGALVRNINVVGRRGGNIARLKGRCLNNLGVCIARQKKFSQAGIIFDKASSLLDPSDPEFDVDVSAINSNVAFALIHQGRAIEAEPLILGSAQSLALRFHRSDIHEVVRQMRTGEPFL